jgi:hypothetical protein
MLRDNAVPAWPVLGAGLRILPEGTPHADRFIKVAWKAFMPPGPASPKRLPPESVDARS